MYLIKGRKDVLAKYKYPHPLERCDCEAVGKLIWMRDSANKYVDDRCFFSFIKYPKKTGECNFVKSTDEQNTTNAKNLVLQFRDLTVQREKAEYKRLDLQHAGS